jgi:hypothetical protein
MNIAPSTANKAPKKIKMKKLRLPHPCSLDVLPSPIDKWSTTTHPIKAWVIGYLGYHISYKHFYFHQSRVLLTKAFATSTTASTVGDGGTPKGSTELDTICGFNCAMEKDEFHMFAQTGSWALSWQTAWNRAQQTLSSQHAPRGFCCDFEPHCCFFPQRA